LKNFIYIGCIAIFFSISCWCNADNKSKSSHANEKTVHQKETVEKVKEYDGIIAIVNGDVITKVDLDKRVNLAIFSIGGNVTQDQKSALSKEVLKEIIQERIKRYCYQKFAPKGGWVSKKDVQNAFSDIARQNRTDYDGLVKILEGNNIKKEILLNQISIGLSWMEYIRARFGKNVNISESEVNRELASLNEKLTKESFYVCRMFFPINGPSEEKSVLSHVNNLNQMLLGGVDFSNIARQFSKGAEANKGGDMGWIFEGQLSPAEMDALRQMSIGSHKIVRNDRGYVILFLRDKKESGLRTFSSIKYTQVGVGFAEGKPSEQDLKQLLNYVNDMRRTSKNCHEFMKKAKESGFMSVSEPSVGVVESMQPKFRAVLEKVQAGGTSSLIVLDGGVIVICLLEKKVNTIKIPTREEIRSQKIHERLNSLAARELQDLTRKSYVKINGKYHVEL
jgi:peptidyl-prolyl cis-trans isomerase SurA